MESKAGKNVNDNSTFFLEALVASDTHPEKIVDYIDKIGDNADTRKHVGLKVLIAYCREGLIEEGRAFKQAYDQKFGADLGGGNRDVDIMAHNMVRSAAAKNKDELRKVINNIFA